MTAGYSKRSLTRKLGIKSGFSVHFVNTPENYEQLLDPLPPDVVIQDELTDSLDFIHYFTKTQQELTENFAVLKTKLAQNGMLWISWPKKASKVETDLNENIIREIGLRNNLVDVKVCAVDEVWSGLKFVYRLKDRH